VRLTTARLRALIVNQSSFIASARAAVAPSTRYGNAQRAWLQAAVRAYVESGRDVDELWRAFNNRVAQRSANQRRQALAEGARRLLERFVIWDENESDLPADSFPPVRDVRLGTHTIAIRRDLIYLDGPGYRVRQLWTTHDLPPTHPRAIEIAAAVMASVDADLGQDSTTAVEVWGLRHQTQRSWSRDQLLPELQRLEQRLDAVQSAIQQP
jgi:hypothetical protein